MFHPLCGYSLQKGARIIAIADLVIVFFSASLRFIAHEYQEYEEYEIEAEYVTSNDTDTHLNSTDHHLELHEWNEHSSAAAANLTANLIEILRQTNAAVEEQQEHLMLVAIITMVIMGLVYIAYLSLEVWMCRLLMRAANNRDASACKTWYWIRLTVTLIVLLFSIVSIATFKHDWVDWALEPLNLYRIYELIVINEFKREIAATSGRVKLRA